jgi:hypothetical protein
MASTKGTPLARKTSRAGARRAPPPAMMMTLRRLHLYIGLFIAPAILFFAFTGSLQLFSLHEAHGAYRPPALIEKLGSVHKDQRFAAKGKPPGAAAHAPDADHDHADADHDHDHDATAPGATGAKAKAPAPEPFKVTALKWLFLVVAAGLFLSTCLGVWMGLTFARSKPLAWLLLLAGAALPVLLIVL